MPKICIMYKLLQINVCYGYFSTGKIVESINQVVKGYGWDTFVAYRGDVQSKNNTNLIPMGNVWSKYEHYIYSLLFDKHGQGSKLETKALIRKIKNIKPDIIHLHNLHGYYINIELLLEYLVQSKIPTVITIHDCWLFTGHCAHFTKVQCVKWKSECHDCPLSKSYPRSLIDNSGYNFKLKKAILSRFDDLHIVTVSKWLGNVVKDSFLGRYNISTISNGIDINKFRILNEPISIKSVDDNVKVILGVSSSWYDDKGLQDYYSLSKILPKNVILCLVGLDEKQRKKLPSNITGISKTRNVEELVRLYNRAEIVLSLSKSETFGLTIVEGYACGTPAIVYDNTALPELITDKTGIIVPNGDVHSVKKAICKMLNFGKEKYSTACRKLACEKYNDKYCFSRYYKLYSEILKSIT